jgi:hypothetical protein
LVVVVSVGDRIARAVAVVSCFAGQLVARVVAEGRDRSVAVCAAGDVDINCRPKFRCRTPLPGFGILIEPIIALD